MDISSLCIVVIVTFLALLAFLSVIKKKVSGSGTYASGRDIPGLKVSHAQHGNLDLITKHGGFNGFLLWLHQQYGPIAKFWFGEQMVVSIASPQLFKETSRMFDRPGLLFKMLEIIITEKAIQYANKEDGKWRRNTYDSCYSHNNVMKSIGMLQKLSEEMVARWSQIPHGEHVPCRQGMFMFAIKAIMQSSLGNFFLQDEEVLKFWESYNTSWSDMEQIFLKGDFPQPGSEREKIFNEAKRYMYDTIAAAIEVGRKRPTTEKRKMLIDVMIENNIPYDVMQCDVLMFIIGGFHTTANSLLWALTFISAHSDVQEKMYQEVKNILGDTGKITPDNIGQLVYTRQVIDEALRVAKIAPYAARFDDENDVKLGDYVIPAGTPIIQAINVEYNDPVRWPNPNEFDPDRFSPEKVSERHPYSFQPFGFAGKRKCPGYRFAYAEVTTALANILLSFQIQGVKGQEVKASCGLLGALDDEVWITLEKRSSGSVQPMK